MNRVLVTIYGGEKDEDSGKLRHIDYSNNTARRHIRAGHRVRIG